MQYNPTQRMSYQSPYQPPQTNYPNFDYYQPDALAPARRAGLLMYVMGALLILSSLCCGGVGAMLPQVIARSRIRSASCNIRCLS